MWFKKVPELDLTSLIHHCPSLHQNSQCLRDTTLDLKPTGAEDGTFGGRSLGMLSFSEYLPTLMTQSSLGRVLDIGGNCRLGREALGSSCGIKRIEGSCLFGIEPSAVASPAAGPWWDTPSEGAALSARLRVIEAGRGEVAEVVEGSAEEATRDSPLRPTTVGTQPLVAPAASAEPSTGA